MYPGSVQGAHHTKKESAAVFAVAIILLVGVIVGCVVVGAVAAVAVVRRVIFWGPKEFLASWCSNFSLVPIYRYTL